MCTCVYINIYIYIYMIYIYIYIYLPTGVTASCKLLSRLVCYGCLLSFAVRSMFFGTLI